MKILMLPTYFGGISYWRFEVPARALRAQGHEVTCPTADQVNNYLNKGRSFKEYLATLVPDHDLAHVGYSPELDTAKAFLEVCDHYKKPLVVDIDDDMDSVPPYNKGWKTFRPGSPGQRITKTLLKHAQAVTFSTEPLQAALGYVNPNNVVCHNWLDLDTWDHPVAVDRNEDKSIRILLTGGSGRYGDWQILKEPLEWAMRKYDGLEGRPLARIFFLGATPDWAAQWLTSKEDPSANRAFYIQPNAGDVTLYNRVLRWLRPDIMLSPTECNTFNCSKSGLKFLEATLIGAAFACTDWPTYALAPEGACLKVNNSFAQWQDALERLIEQPSLRKQLQERAFPFVMDTCQAKDYTNERLDLYERLLAT